MSLKRYKTFTGRKELFVARKMFKAVKKQPGSIHKVFIKNADIDIILDETTINKCMKVFNKRKFSEKTKRKIIRKVFILYCFHIFQQIIYGEVVNIGRLIYIYGLKVQRPNFFFYIGNVLTHRDLFSKTRIKLKCSISNNMKKRMYIFDQTDEIKYEKTNKILILEDHVF